MPFVLDDLRATDRDAVIASLHEGPPVRRIEHGNWLISGYDECATVVRDLRLSSDTRNAIVLDATVEESAAFGGSEMPVRPYLFFDPPTYVAGRPFLFLDPPDHTRLRRLVSRAFTPRVVADLRPRVEQLVDAMVAPSHDGFDVVGELAYPLPLRVIMDLLGLGESQYEVIRACAAPLVGFLDADYLRTPEERDDARRAQFMLAGLLQGEAEARRAQPGPDLLSGLVRAEDAGDTLTPFEVVSTAILLLLAGHETTANLIGNAAVALDRHRDQLALLASDPSLADAAVEEALRYDPPVQLLARTALEPLELAGSRIERGEHVLVLIAAANRDPRHFAEPDRFVIGRTDASSHLGFGFGVHHCLGAPLARLEAEIALRVLVERMPDLTVARLEYRDDLVVRGPRSLHLRTMPTGAPTPARGPS